MYRKTRFTQIACLIAAFIVFSTTLLTGCGAPAPIQATREIVVESTAVPLEMVAVTREVEVEAVYQARSTAPPPNDGPYPSTGGLVPPNDEPYADTFYEHYGVNPFIDTEDDHLSTFAVDVDTASYTIMRRYLRDGYLPPKDSVRVEEYVNFFEQDYEPPARRDGAFAMHLEGAPSRYGNERHYLVRVGIKGYEIPPEARKDVNLTFVIDVSGSMSMENRLALVKDALWMLVEELRPTDRVGIVIYGSQGRVILEPTFVGDGKRHILRAIDGLVAGGSTYAEEGLILGYRIAAEAFDPQVTNRVILCSDGVANVGHTGPNSILEQIRDYADRGIYLTTVGFGMGNYNDVLMEQLANNGDGFYAYVDTLKEAERVFVKDLTSTLQVIARDAKIQVDFNPAVVQSYRLIGYENRDVADEDFRNDDVDAGEVGPGHSVTALYEIKFHAEASRREPALTARVRYEDPDLGEVIEIARSIAWENFAPSFKATSARFQWAAVVAEYAEILRESYWARESGLEDVLWEARRVAEYLPHDEDVAEFVRLAEQANGIGLVNR
ncbi:MAG TPA: DUF3520 domain-containing protein [Chloroflexi bacterium]|nr:DUF3520 domain-containing protein [Chloroflexota bacterium]